jgi:phosphohistidine phosphatase
MKVLYLFRHSKSDWSDGSVSDLNRGLNKRGQSDAPFMGKILKERGVRPDSIISSPAKRAKLTATIISEQLELQDHLLLREEIYEASPRSLLGLVNNLDDLNDEVLIVGHNPTFTYLAEFLTKEDLGNIPTSGCVKIKFDLDSWQMVSEGAGDLIWFEYPKKYSPE